MKIIHSYLFNYFDNRTLFLIVSWTIQGTFHKEYRIIRSSNQPNYRVRETATSGGTSHFQKRSSGVVTPDSCHALCHPAKRGLA